MSDYQMLIDKTHDYALSLDAEELARALHGFTVAYPEEIFPTPPSDQRPIDAAAAYIMRRVALPWFEAASLMIHRQQQQIEDFRRREVDRGWRENPESMGR